MFVEVARCYHQALLLLQGVSELLKCIYAFRTGRWLVIHRTLEELVTVIPQEKREP